MIQITPPQNPQYWINQRALTFSENDLENVNRIAVSLVSGTVIMVYEKGVIDYAPDGNFQKWTLKGYSTRLVSDLAHKIYARLSRTEKDALIVFSINNYNIDGSITTIVTDANGNPVLDEDGKEQTTTSEPNPNYWYVKIGEITATNGISNRELTYDSGALGTKKGEAETGSWTDMFELSKESTPWLIFVKQMFYEFTVKNPITLLSGLIFKNSKGVEKKVVDVKRSTDSDNEYLLDEEGNPILNAEGSAVKDDSYVPVSDETIPTTKYVEEKIEGFEGKYIRKDVDDGTPHSLSVGKNLEVGGSSTTKGDSKVEGNLSSDGTLSVKGEATIDSSLEVGGNSTTKGDSKVEGNLSSDGTLSVKGEAVIDSSLEVGGNSTTKGDSKVEGALSVDGKATFKDGFSSSGESKINGDLLLNEKKISNFTRFYDEEKPMSSDISFYSSLMTDHRIEEEIEKIDDRFLRKDKEDTAQEHITFNKGITVNDLAKLMNLEVSELATIARAIVQVIGSSKFVDGFAGEGFQIWQDIASGDWNMTLDRITVRKVMMIYELIIQKIRSVGGTIVVSAGNGRIKTIEEVGFEYKFTFEDVNTFAVGDLIRCKVYSTVGMKDYWVEVTHVVGDSVYTRISDYGDVKPEIGDEVVLMGNTRNVLRQNMILISATEDGQPRFDCMDGIKSKSFENCLKVRVGCLDGISDDRFPSDLQPSGYGIYGNNCFLTGVFVLSNGTDVRTQFMILEGMIRSEISSVRSEVNQKDNYLTNSSFSSNLQSWIYSNDVKVFNTSGGLLHFNGDFYSEKRNFAGIVESGSKRVLRIKNSHIKQLNGDFNMKPSFSMVDVEMEGVDGTEIVQLYKPRMFYISFKYMCATSGILRIYFSGEYNNGEFDEYESIDYSEEIKTNGVFSLKEISGKWNGTGDFYLSFDGDIYIYDLALADNALADLEERVTMRFEMTDQKIQANGEAIRKNDGKIEEYYSEWKLTAEEMSADFEKSIKDTYNKVTKEYKTHVSVTAEEITVDMESYINDVKSGIEEDYESQIKASAKDLTSSYEADIKNLKDGLLTDMQTQISQNAEDISLRAYKTDLDLLSGDLDTKYSELSVEADGIRTSVGNVDSRLNAAIKRIDTAEDALDAVEKRADELDEYLDDAFKDGIIDEAEAISIKKYLNSLANTMAGLESSYNNVINHEALSGKPERAVLVEKYGNLVSKYNELVSTINSAIADGKATGIESASVDSAFNGFNAAIDSFNSALENARYKIAGFYAEKAVDTAEKALYDALPDDYKTKEGTYASALVQMAEGISTIAGRFDSNGKLIEGAGWITEATGNSLWATNNTVNELGETVQNNTSLIRQQSDKISALVTETGELGTKQSALEQTADSIILSVSDVDSRLDAAIKRIQTAEEALDVVEDKTDELDKYIDESFKDGIIDESEAIAIKKYLNSLANTMAGLQSSYNNVINHEALSGKTERTVLVEKYGTLVSKYNSLVSTISTAIADGKATDEESRSVDNAFTDFNAAIDAFNSALENARYKIAGFYAEKAVDTAEKALYDALPDDYKTKDGTYASALVQMAEGISTIAGRFDSSGKLIEGAGWVTTAQGNQLWATNNTVNALDNTVKNNTTLINQQADNITLLATETDALGTRQTTLEQTADGLSIRVTNVETGNTTNSNKISAIDVRLSAIESFVGEGGDIEGNFDSFKNALDELAADITSNTEKAAAAQKTADEAKGLSESNLTKITQNAQQITALAGKVTTDASGNITNISTSGLVLDSEFASLFSTQVSSQGIAKTAQLDAYVLETELGDLVSKIQISADQINLSGVITSDMLSQTLKNSLASSSEVNELQESLNQSVANLNTTISGLQTEVSQKASLKNLNDKVSELNTALSGKADTSLKNAVIEGNTLIVGGYINTDLIQASELRIKNSQVSGLGALATKDAVTTADLGLSDWVKKSSVKAAMEGETIIVGGYINTSLINTGAITISSDKVTGLGALATKDAVTTADLGLSDWVKKSSVKAAMEGETIIVGGYINTNLINTGAITISSDKVTGLGALATKDAVTTTDLGLSDWVKKSSVTAAMEGETIIVGGYINTDLIKADAIIAKQLSTATDANGFNVEASSGSIVLMKNGSSVIGITADGITPTLRVGSGASEEHLLMTPDALSCYSGTNKTIRITRGSLNLDYAATIKGFAIGNFHSSTFGGTTDFAVASGTRTLPLSTTYPGKVIFIKCNGNVTFNTTGSDKIVRWSSNAQVSSISTDGSSLFFISNGSGLWYGFVCH